MAERTDFLLEMYKQMCAEIDRHIKATWQILGVLLSAFAIFALIDKGVISPNIAASILIAVCGLSIAIIIEANFWYNRNLVIIANIERQFLEDDDAKNVHYYFLQHRTNNAYLDMMISQILFVIMIVAIVIIYHISQIILPSFSLSNQFDFYKTPPYMVLIVCIIFLVIFHRKRKVNYNEFVTNSPGKDMTIAITKHPIVSNSDHVTK